MSLEQLRFGDPHSNNKTPISIRKMKSLTLLAASVLALSLAGTADAQTKIYITGSTAFRSATTTAIDGVLTGTVTKASDNATFTSANAVTWTGGSVGGQPVTIKASWSGSTGGIQTVAGSLPVRFLPDGATGTANPDPRNPANPAEVATPDMNMMDSYQSATFFNGTFQGVTYQTLVDNLVGVVTFRWLASNGFPADQTMTTQLAQYLFGNGVIPAALFTGNTADQNRLVFATGRDPDSGTRTIAFAESGIGVFSIVKQYKPTFSGTDNTVIVSQALYPVQVINGVSTQFPGNSGESSGSTLRTFTNKTFDPSAFNQEFPAATAAYYVTYMGTSDAAVVLAAATKPAVSLKWHGVEFSTTAVQEGQYTFWGYQHLGYRPGLSGTKLTFATALKNQILGTSAAVLAPNVKLSDMKVSRAADGGLVGADYF
jgi:hypothetical protein